MTVQASADGTTFVDIGTITGTGVNAIDTGWTSTFFTIGGAQLAAGSRIRFVSSSGDDLYVDDVSIRVAQVNSATVTATDSLNTTATATDTEAVTLGNPPLSITKTASPAFVRNGDTLTYTVTVTNNSTSVPQSNVTDRGHLPERVDPRQHHRHIRVGHLHRRLRL